MADAFSLQDVLDNFKSSLSDNKEVFVKYYISGWRELVRYFVCFLLCTVYVSWYIQSYKL